MIVLGIESSCDETSVGIVRDGTELLANVVFSSMDLHKAFGGIVPEIAARSHIEAMIPTLQEALDTAFPNHDDPWSEIDGIAVTYGAGLGGSLMVGAMTAKTLAISKNKPLYAVNHVEAHVYASFLTDSQLSEYTMPDSQPDFPLLAIIISGKHSQLALFRDHNDYTLLGQTRDDAIGEAFDKVAKIAGLPYPGGPSIAAAAAKGDAHKYELPKAKLDSPYDFSFSGPKTAVLRLAQREIGEDYRFPSWQLARRLSEAQKNDIAASFQRIAVETIVDKAMLAVEEHKPNSLLIAGGVAASHELRNQVTDRLNYLKTKNGSITTEFSYPDLKLCTDNGAMVATLGCYHISGNLPTTDPYSLAIDPSLSM